MRIFRIFYCSLLIFCRTLVFPFVILRNFYLLRKHRYNYKKVIKNGTKKFSDEGGYLSALRAQMGEDIYAANSGTSFDSGIVELLRLDGQSDNKQQGRGRLHHR